MPEGHIEPEILRRFLDGKLSDAGNREVVKHLLRRCSHCRRMAAAASYPRSISRRRDGTGNAVSPQVLKNVYERQAQLARERREAPKLLQELDRHPPERRLILAANSWRFQTWGLCELLLEGAWHSRFDNADQSSERADLAVVVAEALDGDRYGEPLVCDLAARAWAHLGNALRISSDYRDAESTFERAQELLAAGTGDPLEKAQVLRMKAALRCAQERFDEAVEILDRVVALYRVAGDLHLVGLALVKKGTVLGYRGDLEAAISMVRQSLELMEPDRNMRCYLAARHNLAYLLHEYGLLEEALKVLKETWPLYDALGDRLNLLRLRWFEGRIALTLGRFTVAEEALLNARDGFLEQGIGYDTAEVSLELALLYAGQGRMNKLRDLAVEMLPIFDSRDMHLQALAALLAFQKAVEGEIATQEVIEQILADLRKTGQRSTYRTVAEGIP